MDAIGCQRAEGEEIKVRWRAAVQGRARFGVAALREELRWC